MTDELVNAAWLPTAEGYLAREDANVIRALRRWEGIVDQDDLEVTATTTASMQVNVAPGRAIIDNDPSPPAGGSYVFSPPNTIQLTHDPSDSSDRIDVVGIIVYDNDFDGSGNEQAYRTILKGDPAAPGSQPVIPSPPADCSGFISLAFVTIGAGVTSITQDKIRDVRNRTDHKPFVTKVHAGVQTTLPANGNAKIQLDQIDWDPASCWDPVNNEYTCKISGNYMVVGQVTRNVDSAGSFLEANILIWTPENPQYKRYASESHPTYTGFAGAVQVTWGGNLTKGSKIQLWGYSQQGFNNVTNLAELNPWLNVVLLD